VECHYSGPAEALFTVVEDDVLSGSCAGKRRVEPYVEYAVRVRDAARGVRLAVTQLHRAAKIRGRRSACDPVWRGRADTHGEQRGVFRALDDDQHVAGEILARHEPRRFDCAPAAADAEPAALAKRVALEAAVAADDRAVRRLDRAGAARQPATYEVAERPLADEADSGGVPLVRDRQASLPGDAPDFRLAQAADRELCARQLPGVERVEEVTLVFGPVDAAQQAPAVFTRVMSGRKAFGAETPGVVERDAELHLAIAQHVRIRRAAGFELGQEAREHALAVLAGEARLVQRNAKLLAHATRILEIGGRRAVAVVVLRPIGHEESLDVVAGVLQERSRDRGIHAPRKCDDDACHDVRRAPRARQGRGAGVAQQSRADSARRAGSPRRTAAPADCGAPRPARRVRPGPATGP